MPTKAPTPRTTRNSRGLRAQSPAARAEVVTGTTISPQPSRAAAHAKARRGRKAVASKKKKAEKFGTPLSLPLPPLPPFSLVSPSPLSLRRARQPSYPVESIRRSHFNRAVHRSHQRPTARKGPVPVARRLQAIEKREGYSFSKGLWTAINNDHHMRGCQCGTPTIYKSKEEAETAGEGRLRFYLSSPFTTKNLRVLVVPADKKCHCHCGEEVRPTYLPIVRKRTADEAEIDEVN